MTISTSTFTRGPNWTYNLLGVTTPAEYKVLSACVRMTYGWSEEWSEATAGDIAELTHLQRTTVVAILAKFVAVGLLERMTGYRNSYRWRLVEVSADHYELSAQTTDETMNCRPTRQLTVGSDDSKLSAQTTPYIRKKERVKKEEKSAADAAPAVQQTTTTEITQPPLLALSEPDPPVAATPLPAAPARKPRATPKRPTATPEQAAIRRALLDAAMWGPSGKAHKQAADNGDVLMALDPAVTPERIARFAARWFPRHSPVGATKVRNQETAANPTPAQVLQFWPGFQAWEQAQQRPLPPPPPASPPPAPEPTETLEERRARIAALHPFRNAQPSARPALVASGRQT